jgi:hypothetical protein
VFFFGHFAHGLFGINITGNLFLLTQRQKKSCKILAEQLHDFGDCVPETLGNISRLGL